MVALKGMRERVPVAVTGADLGGSSNYSNENFED